jgi:hypothetical protein
MCDFRHWAFVIGASTLAFGENAGVRELGQRERWAEGRGTSPNLARPGTVNRSAPRTIRRRESSKQKHTGDQSRTKSRPDRSSEREDARPTAADRSVVGPRRILLREPPRQTQRSSSRHRVVHGGLPLRCRSPRDNRRPLPALLCLLHLRARPVRFRRLARGPDRRRPCRFVSGSGTATA